MPKQIWLPRSENKPWNSGISVTYTKSCNRIDISAFYDSFVGIEGESVTLSEFFEMLEIPAAKIRAALKNMESTAHLTTAASQNSEA